MSDEPKDTPAESTSTEDKPATNGTDAPPDANKKQLDPSSMDTKELLEHITEAEECKHEYMNRCKQSAEEFVNRTYRIVSQRNWKNNREGSGTGNSVITALIDCGLVTESKADRYLERKTSKCTLKTSLCDDLFGFLNSALKPVREKLTTEQDSEILIAIVSIYFQALYEGQKQYRDELLRDRELCCAGANDFGQMAFKAKELAQHVRADCPLAEAPSQQLQECVEAILQLYTKDASFAAQKVSHYIFKEMTHTTPSKLFTKEWMTKPDSTIVKDLLNNLQKNYVTPLKEDLNPAMVPKTVQAMATRYVHYYLEQLLQTSTEHKSKTESYFGTDNATALAQIKADIDVSLEYFESLAEDKNKPLIEAELELLEVVHKILVIAAGLDQDDDDESEITKCVLALQMRVEKYDTTYYILGDLYHLVNPPDERKAYEIAKTMARDLRAWNKRGNDPAAGTVPGLCLRSMLMEHLVQSRGQRTRVGAGPLNNFFGWLGKTGENTPVHKRVSQPEKKLTHDELESELSEVRQELQEHKERADQAEERVEELRKQLAQANERAKKAEKLLKEKETNGKTNGKAAPVDDDDDDDDNAIDC